MTTTTIWKFSFTGSPGDINVLDMPKGAVIIHAGVNPNDENAVPCIWAEVDLTATGSERRIFSIFGTGWGNTPKGSRHLGTYFSGPFVWHIYELTEVTP